MMVLVQTLTNFGNLAVLLPLVVVVTLWLLLNRQPLVTIGWLAAVGLCAGATAIVKIYFFVCPLSDLQSPSGHTSLSTLVYGAITLIVATTATGWQRYLLIALGSAFVAVIGITRIVLQFHSTLEVLFGLVIGAAALGLFARTYRKAPMNAAHLRPFIVSVAVIMLLLNGYDLRAEDLLHHLALYLRIGSIGCA